MVESLRLRTPEGRDVLLLCELVLNEGVEEFVVEGRVPGLVRSGDIAMCLDAAENPMMYVP